MQDCKCANFSDDSGKQSWCLLSIVSEEHEVITKLREICLDSLPRLSTPEFMVKPIDKVNIIYSAPFFISGGKIYLYRQGLKNWVEKHWIIALASCLVLTILRFVVDIKGLFILPDLLVFAAWLIYVIGSKDIVLNNRVAKYLSGISMEIYLCHMMFFRVASMLH